MFKFVNSFWKKHVFANVFMFSPHFLFCMKTRYFKSLPTVKTIICKYIKSHPWELGLLSYLHMYTQELPFSSDFDYCPVVKT